ncbi:unnamed protein product [Pleuronectes platessa]|uniref:Uncharacterized protein n=1 Tax=Pleuronectes platessa TaxID=8262 RepID=A0A9N7TPS4_PLEPL|nr:unnamed protein product [Pleuronectes platessa]
MRGAWKRRRQEEEEEEEEEEEGGRKMDGLDRDLRKRKAEEEEGGEEEEEEEGEGCTPYSEGLWVLLTGSDLFTLPRDKVGLPAYPWSNTHRTCPSRTPLHMPRTRRCCRWRPGPLGTLHLRCVWSPRAPGVGSGLIRSSMMK